jgi:glutathione synthase/RimK-type ligase-like ATP-grasp enzyme
VTGTGPRIAFVSHAALPHLSADDQLAVQELGRRGTAVAAVVWDDPNVDWLAFDLVVIRSTWDYPQRSNAFLDWLEHLERVGARVWNPPQLVRWNLDKRYLRDLGVAGVATAPTVWLDADGGVALRELLEERGWRRAVVKPVVSADGVNTWSTSLDTARPDQHRFEQALSDGPLMVQRYLPEVTQEGEWSLIFVDGQLSHTILKRPAPGDFRVQERYGGSATAAQVDAELVATARTALAALSSDWLYARVDIVRSAGMPLVMELELIEPSLFLVADPHAPARFAAALESFASLARC